MTGRTDKNLYIIGAGFAGQMLAEEIARKKIFGNVIAFLDDDQQLIGTHIDGIPVLGPINTMTPLLRRQDNDEAIIAIPTASGERLKEIFNVLRARGFSKIKILPAISQIVEGSAHLVQTRDIDPLDILGRTPVTISLKKSLAYLRGKRVLITGAGGSIGSELARQLLSGGAERLYLLGHGEFYLSHRQGTPSFTGRRCRGKSNNSSHHWGFKRQRVYKVYCFQAPLRRNFSLCGLQACSPHGRKPRSRYRKQCFRYSKSVGSCFGEWGTAICADFHR